MSGRGGGGLVVLGWQPAGGTSAQRGAANGSAGQGAGSREGEQTGGRPPGLTHFLQV